MKEKFQIRADTAGLLALRAPNDVIRSACQNALADAARTCRPSLSLKKIMQIITSTDGTPLTPFVVDDEIRETAVHLTAIALSDETNHTSFRIASQDTIRGYGGLIIHSNGTTDYIEGNISDATCPYIAASKLCSKDELDKISKRSYGSIDWSNDRYEIRLNIKQELLPYKQHCRISRNNLLPRDIGLELSHNGNQRLTPWSRFQHIDPKSIVELVISTTSPESIMQLTALSSDNCEIALSRDGKVCDYWFELPELTNLPQTFLVHQERHVLNWSDLETSVQVLIEPKWYDNYCILEDSSNSFPWTATS